MHKKSYKELLVSLDILREPMLRQIFSEINLPKGSRGLDLACGVGVPSMILAEMLKPDIHITDTDISAEFIEEAKKASHSRGLDKYIDFKEGDAQNLPFPDNTFDWLISIDYAGYRITNSNKLLKEITRVLKKGGKLILICWSSQQLLAGYPELEAKLNITKSGMAPFEKGMKPQEHYLRVPECLYGAGFTDIRCKTYAGSNTAPFSKEEREALQDLISMRWKPEENELDEDEFALFSKLCSPTSPHNILGTKGLYVFYTYSVFCARVKK